MPAPRRLPLLVLCVLVLTALCIPSLAYAGTATATTLQVTPVCLSQGCVTTLTATVVADPSAVHPGLVYFCDGTAASCENGIPVGRAQLLVNGTATIKSVLPSGIHHLHAVFHGTSTYNASSSATHDLTVAASTSIATQTYIGSSNTALPPGEYSLSGVANSLGPSAPTGSISYRDTSYGNAVLATAPLGAGTAPQFIYNTGGLDFSQIPGTILASASKPVSGDFNNDGFQDILVLDQAGLQVLLGSGTGRFTAAPKGANNLPAVVCSMLVADFNSDGKLDIAFSDPNGKSIRVSFGNGDGTFADAKSSLLANTPGQLYLGDFNNDGIPDLIADVQVAGSQAYEFQPLLGKGDGTFTATSAAYSTGATGPAIVADFDSDGMQDLVVTTTGAAGSVYPAQFAVLHGNGDGTFGAVKLSPSFSTLYMVAGDFNADGILDLVTYDGSFSLLAYWQGIGDGTFVQLSNVSPVDFFSSSLNSLIVGDFDGDGVLDVGGVQMDRGEGTTPSYFTAFLHFSTTSSADFPQQVSTPPISMNVPFDVPTPPNLTNLVVGAFGNNGLPSVVYFVPSTVATTPVNFIADFNSVAHTTQSNTVTLTTPGVHNVVASYPGDNSHAASVSAPVTLSAPAQINDGSGFTSSAGLALNGGATLQGGILQLTDGKTFEARSAFYQKRVPVYSFSTTFDFQIASPNSDGLAFVIQSNGPNAIGSNGGGLGYGQTPGATSGPSIRNSVAIIFDTHNNQGEGNNSIRVETGGVTNLGDLIDLTSSGIDLRSGHHFRVVIAGYNGVELNLSLTDLDTRKVFSQNLITLDIVSAIGDTIGYVGFTSATGATASIINILNWNYAGQICCVTPATAVLPSFPDGFTNAASTIQLNKGAAIVGSELQLTNDTPFEATSAFFKTPNDQFFWISDFDFTIQGTGGDGFTFLVQGNGPGAVGTSGGALGYGPYFPGESGYGIGDSLAIKFDVHNNGGEGINSTGLYFDGAYPSVPAIDLTSSRINLRSGHRFHARILSAKDATIKMSITDLDDYAVFDNSLYSRNDDNSIFHAYPGFTAGTGATANTIKILNWTFGYY
ncbi:hypothetical protein HDF16_005312 [Granulicella aggregans]|uniref:VCBS repeat protein n=1 Tax=Granulicella aggregans TaxID=474949 RepID=A0A7W7ZIN5_9BACT|nr:FG-GAP-like repeat-containing protein [Granulicella aggregans]MBB5060576.1 hypothetical protein [Granulicella aggregans]